LEAMQEKQVTVGNKTYPLDRPFFILATQNPIEMEGTFPLPEAQLDRFLLKIFMEYPTTEEELEILERYTIRAEPAVSPQVSKAEVIALQQLCRDIPIADDLKRAVEGSSMAPAPAPPSASSSPPRPGHSCRGGTMSPGRICM